MQTVTVTISETETNPRIPIRDLETRGIPGLYQIFNSIYEKVPDSYVWVIGKETFGDGASASYKIGAILFVPKGSVIVAFQPKEWDSNFTALHISNDLDVTIGVKI